MADYLDVHRKYQISFEEGKFRLVISPVGQEEGGPSSYSFKEYSELISSLTRELADTLHISFCNTFYDLEVDLKVKDILSKFQVKTIEQLVGMRNEVSKLKRTAHDAKTLLENSLDQN